MVLTSKNQNVRSRLASNSQNIPPRHSASRSLAHRLRNSIEAARRHNRTNNQHSPSEPNSNARPRKSKTTRSQKAVESKSLDFEIRPIHAPFNDVEMGDGTPSSKSRRISIPRELSRPVFDEVDYKKLIEIDEKLADVPLTFLRENLDLMSPDFIQSLSSVSIQKAEGTSNLPTEVDILVNDLTTIAPSHVLAVTEFNKPRPGQIRKVSLYPAHSVVFLAQCAKMPNFPPVMPLPDHRPGQQMIRVPVFPIGIPHPETFSPLLHFLYSKNQTKLIVDLVALPPPPMLSDDPNQLVEYANRLALTYTEVALVQFAARVHGLWQNACGFSIDNIQLWDTLDLLWEVLLTALAIATGQPQLMIPKDSTTAQSGVLPLPSTTTSSAT